MSNKLEAYCTVHSFPHAPTVTKARILRDSVVCGSTKSFEINETSFFCGTQHLSEKCAVTAEEDGLVCCLLLIVVCSAAVVQDVEVCSAKRLNPMQLLDMHAGQLCSPGAVR
uniref:Uncharacterized protein n=1 Tax=Timema bartmani TaxID=61472 RepID=A0A7R9HXP1_9NEOP|nr:unnamed protein product [Timema bartmani]